MMNLLSFFAVSLIILCSSNLYAIDTQDIEKLRLRVLEETNNYYKRSFGEHMFNERVQISVGKLDNRLKLAQCDDNLTFKIHEPPQKVHNITVKTSCAGQHRWTVYVPATVDVFSDVLVVKTGLQKGDVLSSEHLSYKRINTSKLGHGSIEDIDRAAGMQLKRPLRTGEVLRYAYLVKPNIVHKGQTVVLSSKSKFLSVETSGVALVSGYLGQNIKVKNPNSNRVIDAQVIAPGKVMIATR